MNVELDKEKDEGFSLAPLYVVTAFLLGMVTSVIVRDSK